MVEKQHFLTAHGLKKAQICVQMWHVKRPLGAYSKLNIIYLMFNWAGSPVDWMINFTVWQRRKVLQVCKSKKIQYSNKSPASDV